MNIKKNLARLSLLLLLVFAMLSTTACDFLAFLPIPGFSETDDNGNGQDLGDSPIDLSKIPEYTGNPYIEINDNKPFFESSEITTTAFEKYGELDRLGRCTVALACCGKETMPKPDEDRGSISSVKPTGWIQAQYDCVSGKSLYNRSHLIGWQITAENANKQNLITGTTYMNHQGMLPFENMIADYIKETGNHVMYRVTPIFIGDNLLASGVQLEAYSVEDEGEGICFNVYCYNVQPGISLNYADGSSKLDESSGKSSNDIKNEVASYVLNTGRKKIHLPECSSVEEMSAHNRQEYTGTIADLLKEGYTTCGSCLAGIG